MTVRVALPDLNTLNAEALRALILAQQAHLTTQDEEILHHREELESKSEELVRKDEQLALREAEITSHKAEIERLKLLILKLRRMQYGRKSEKPGQQIEQLELQLEALEMSEAKVECEPATTASSNAVQEGATGTRSAARAFAARDAPARAGRAELSGLWRQAAEVGGGCFGDAGVRAGRIQGGAACAGEAELHALRARGGRAAPSRPIERGMAGPGLLAHVLVSKYAHHLPLYRQSEIYARAGLELERSTLADWVGEASQLMEPLVESLRRYVMAAEKLHADDTPVPVLAPGTGKTKTGRLWTYVRDDRPAGTSAAPAVWFAYSPDRKGEHPARHLTDFKGVLQADAYAGFNAIYESGRVEEAACWAHVRRKFYDLEQAHHSPVAQEALKRIAELYGIESEIRGRPPSERREVRQARARPRLESMRQWLESCLPKLSRKSETTAAVKYALGLWPALMRYADDGRLEIDNNAAERALRAVALGRKNYLFAGSDAGGERAAIIYSLIGTAKLNGIDPEKYLAEILTRIADHPINRIEELLPWNLAVTLAPATQPAP